MPERPSPIAEIQQESSADKESEVEKNPLLLEIKRENESRRFLAQNMAEQGVEVKKILEILGNDYEKLEKYYRQVTGSELVTDPYQSLQKEFPINKTTISVVVPAYNNGERLQKCLLSIEGSTFNAKYNDKLEVIVIDDGSTKGENHIRDAVQELIDQNLLNNLNVKVYRQPNGGVGKARFTGVNLAQNEYIIFHDPDVVQNPNLIEEYAKRFEVLDNIAMFGPRGHIEEADYKIKNENLQENLPNMSLDIQEDARWLQDHLTDSENLKKFGEKKEIWVDHEEWGSYSFFWGLNVAMKKEDLLKRGVGYDARIKGWGADDDLLASQVLSLGNYAIPCPSAFCHHIIHESRVDQEKRRKNIETLKDTLASPPKKPLEFDASEIETKIDISSQKTELQSQSTNMPSNDIIAVKMLKIGYYDTADKYSQEAKEQNPEDGWILSDRAIIKLAKNEMNEAFQLQKKVKEKLPDNPYIEISLAKMSARIGDYNTAMAHYFQARSKAKSNLPEIEEIFTRSAESYKNEGSRYLKEGKFRMALRLLDKCLTKEPDMMWAEYDKGHALMGLGLYEKAYGSAEKCNILQPNNTWIITFMGKLSIKLAKIDRAKQELNQALKIDSNNHEAKDLLQKTR